MSQLLLSFQSGIVRPMLGEQDRPSHTFGTFAEEAVIRCKNMAETASIVDKETLKVVGRVCWKAEGYVYVPGELLS